MQPEMKFSLWSLLFSSALAAIDSDRLPLEYAALPNGSYAPSKNASTTTVFDFIQSRSDLSTLGDYLAQSAGKYLFHFSRVDLKVPF